MNIKPPKGYRIVTGEGLENDKVLDPSTNEWGDIYGLTGQNFPYSGVKGVWLLARRIAPRREQPTAEQCLRWLSEHKDYVLLHAQGKWCIEDARGPGVIYEFESVSEAKTPLAAIRAAMKGESK